MKETVRALFGYGAEWDGSRKLLPSITDWVPDGAEETSADLGSSPDRDLMRVPESGQRIDSTPATAARTERHGSEAGGSEAGGSEAGGSGAAGLACPMLGGVKTTYYLLPTTYCLLPTTYCLLPTTYYLLPTTYCLLPTTYYLLPTTYYLLPTTWYTY